MSAPPPTIQTAILAQLMRMPLPRRAFPVVDMITALLALHRPGHDTGNHGYLCCAGCAADTAWPCDTVKVMAAGLGLKEGDWR